MIPASLLERSMSLAAAKPEKESRKTIDALKVSPLVKAGLFLRHDFIDDALELAREHDTPDATYWMAIAYRRQPDSYKAKYWYRRLGEHAITEELIGAAAEIGYQYSNGIEFVSYCELMRNTGFAGEKLVLEVQQIEWNLLFEYCQKHKL